jgi:uncharacterized membrane protein
MEEYVYSSSVFWETLNIANQIAYFLFPFVFFAASVIWVVKNKNWKSIMGLCGTSLIVAGMLSHHLKHKVSAVSMGGYSIPHVEENAFIWFLFQYGVNIGLLLFGIAICVYYFKQRSA